MRELANGPRRSGRTTTLLMTMIEEMSMHNENVYLIVSKYCLGNALKHEIKRLNGESSRVRITTVDSMAIVRGVDPRNIYIEHTAYEFATAFQLKVLHELEDFKDNYIHGDKL